MNKLKIILTLCAIVFVVPVLTACSNKDEQPAIFVNPDLLSWTVTNPPQNLTTSWQSTAKGFVINNTNVSVTVKVKITLYNHQDVLITSADVEVLARANDSTEFSKKFNTPVNVGIMNHNRPKIFTLEII